MVNMSPPDLAGPPPRTDMRELSPPGELAALPLPAVMLLATMGRARQRVPELEAEMMEVLEVRGYVGRRHRLTRRGAQAALAARRWAVTDPAAAALCSRTAAEAARLRRAWVQHTVGQVES
jgi:hypothetical protein